jgi:mannose-6-phosphate isomerase
MNQLYPLKFKPIFKDKIWGGDKIKSVMGMDYGSLPNCGEAWIVSGVENDSSEVTNGFLAGNELNELVEVYMGELVGESNFERFGNEFPVLVKILDARDWLSVQVHPDDQLAEERGLGRGKTEMWYVLDAEPGSELISGFSKSISKEEFQQRINSGTIKEVMNYEEVKKGDLFFMPAGRVHALGPGILLAEIQETSDTTYRIYDWDRTDDKGNPRALHIEESIDAIDYTKSEEAKSPYTKKQKGTTPLVKCEHFTTSLIEVSEPIAKDYSALDSFIILICLEGAVRLESEAGVEILTKGETILVPAIMEWIRLFPEGNCSLMEVYLDPVGNE